METYYAYVHARPETVKASGIFYVGKGRVARSNNLSGRNAHHRNIVSKYGKGAILVGRIACSSEDAAFELEKGLIKCLRRMNVELANLTDGGEGTGGLVQTAEHKAKIGAANKGKVRTEETKRKLSISHQGLPANNKGVPSPLRGVPLSAEHRKKLSDQKLVANPMRGNTHTEEAKLKIGAFTSSTRWYTNGIVNKRVQPCDVQNVSLQGFVLGRLPNKRVRADKTIERK